MPKFSTNGEDNKKKNENKLVVRWTALRDLNILVSKGKDKLSDEYEGNLHKDKFITIE